MTTDYAKLAEGWAAKWGVRMDVVYTGHRRYFADDTDTRDTYRITLKRGDRSMSFDYGASLNDSQARSESDGPYWRKRANDRARSDRLMYKGPNLRAKSPTMYDIVCCVCKDDPESFEDWCANFGYDTDSRKALDTYLACQKQAEDFRRLCGADSAMLDEAREIN